jgi:hypothetical protein
MRARKRYDVELKIEAKNLTKDPTLGIDQPDEPKTATVEIQTPMYSHF